MRGGTHKSQKRTAQQVFARRRGLIEKRLAGREKHRDRALQTLDLFWKRHGSGIANEAAKLLANASTHSPSVLPRVLDEIKGASNGGSAELQSLLWHLNRRYGEVRKRR